MVAPTEDERAINCRGGHCPPEMKNIYIVAIIIKVGRPMVAPTVSRQLI